MVVKKATPEELKMLSLAPLDRGQGGEKYREYLRPHDHRAIAYFTTRIVVAMQEEQEAVAMEVEEEVAVAMVVRAPGPGHRSMPIDLAAGEEEETVVQV